MWRLSLIDIGKESGFQWPERVIATFRTGSHLYELDTPDSDEDWTGIFCEPPEVILGIDGASSYVVKVGNKDFTLHSLQKWAALAAKGNPRAVELLFAEPENKTPIWDYITKYLTLNPNTFLAKRHIAAFIGYAKSELRKENAKNKKHAFRLLAELKELLETGKITFPVVFPLAITFAQFEEQIVKARVDSKLPEWVDRERVSHLVSMAYIGSWERAQV